MFSLREDSRSIVARLTACAILMVVIACAAATASRVEPDTRPDRAQLSLVSADGVPSHDAQPGTIPGVAEPEDDQEPSAGAGFPTGWLRTSSPQSARPARHSAHAPFAAPRSVPLRA